MPSKQIRILKDKLAENLTSLTGKTVVVITDKSVQLTGIVISATSAGITIKNSRNRRLSFPISEIAEIYTDEHCEA